MWLTPFQPFKLTSTYIYGLDCIIYEVCRKYPEDKVNIGNLFKFENKLQLMLGNEFTDNFVIQVTTSLIFF